MTSTSPVEESNGKAYVVGQREAGTWVHRSRKEARCGTTEGVQREGLRCGTAGSWDSGVQIWDGRCCERTLDELPTDGLWNNKSVCLICV